MSTDDEEEDFWDDLLGHIRHRKLVAVVGPDLTVAKVGDAEQTFNTLICQRLAEKFEVNLPAGLTTTSEAVAAVLLERGQGKLARLYRVISDVIDKYPEPGTSLRNLAAIDDLRFFVSTTPDRLLAQAMNEVRFQGAKKTRELAFSTTRATSEQLGNTPPTTASETIVLNLFGRAAPTPEYAIHEEDRLEWLHAFRDAASLPEWLDYPLRHDPMLFVGCEIPDWLGRLLLRSSSSTRLSLERKQFFVVCSSTAQVPSLSNFFKTFCPNVQQLEREPGEFVAELRKRWEQQNPPRTGGALAVPIPPVPDRKPIFISYMHKDVEAARQLYQAITTELGGDVWMDDYELRAGDRWDEEILTSIRHSVRLFVPIISANTEREREGYVFEEWEEAARRSRRIPRQRFIVPVIVDADYTGDPSRLVQIPSEFKTFQFSRAPGGRPDDVLRTVLIEEIRAMRSIYAA